MNHVVLCWTHSQMPYPAQRFFSVTNVPSIAVRVTEMCSGQRRIQISRRSWNIIHRQWWYGRVWHQIFWLDLTFLMGRWMRHLIRHCWRRGSYLSWETEGSWMTCGCSTMGHPHTSLFMCAMFWTNIFQAAGLAVAYHCHGHHVVLTLPHQTIDCGVLSREEWLRVATTTTTKICAELWKTPFAQLLQKCSDVCHRGHGGASVCVSSIKVHVRIHWTCNKAYVSDSNQIMVAYWPVYGDFSPTQYSTDIQFLPYRKHCVLPQKGQV